MRFIPILALMLLVGQGEAKQSCPRLNKCKKYTERTKGPCPGCDKRKIYKEYALCKSCARSRKVCSRCGLRPPRKKGSGRIQDAVRSVKAGNIRSYLTHYSGDEFEGRPAGFPGNDKACNWLRDRLVEFGWEPGNKGEWFFPFEVEGRKTRNVMGILPGTDPSLKDEVVIFAAHLDHVGNSEQGPAKQRKNNPAAGNDRIWNGADDNGSGTCTVLEAARALGETGVRGKRSIVVIFLNAEEYGLVGAKKYAENPTYPIEKTVAAINLDMVGRNPTNPYSIGVSGDGGAWQALIQRANQGIGLQLDVRPQVIMGTDQQIFSKHRIPSAGIFSGQHPDYHKQTDHADKIAYPRTEQCARLVVRMVHELATMASPPGR